MGSASRRANVISSRVEKPGKQNKFIAERLANISGMDNDERLRKLSSEWLDLSLVHNYPHNFDWLGVPIIQYPQDILAVQELVWRVRPSVIVETGIARGGSLILSASLLALLDLCFGQVSGAGRRVLGIDIEIRPENRLAIESHPLSAKIKLLEGSSTSPETFKAVKDWLGESPTTMVFLDSNHSYRHVYEELTFYSQLVTPGSYILVFDTVVESLSAQALGGRPWGPGNSPLTAVEQFLRENSSFVVDRNLESKLQISVSPGGFLRKL